jgi:hypothetical protein
VLGNAEPCTKAKQARHGTAWHGMAWRSKAKQARRGMAWHGESAERDAQTNPVGRGAAASLRGPFAVDGPLGR